MKQDEKYKKLMEIVEMVNEIYPDLDRLVVGDLDSPSSVIITSEENLQLIADSVAGDFEIDLEELNSDNDDDDKGTLH